MGKISREQRELEELKFRLDNEKKNRSYDLRLKTILDLEVFLSKLKTIMNNKYRSKSDFIDIAINEKLNNEWEDVFNEKRTS